MPDTTDASSPLEKLCKTNVRRQVYLKLHSILEDQISVMNLPLNALSKEERAEISKSFLVDVKIATEEFFFMAEALLEKYGPGQFVNELREKVGAPMPKR